MGKAVALMALISLYFDYLLYDTSGFIAVILLFAVVLSNSILFPGIFTLGIEGLGKFSEVGSSSLILGAAGGGINPLGIEALID